MRADCRAIVVTTLAVAACGRATTPEQEISAVIAAAEEAAEARSVSGVSAFLSPAFVDDDGRSRDELERYLRGFFVAHQSIHLLTRIDEIVVSADDVASVRVGVPMLGRDAERAAAWNLAADYYEFDLNLQRIDGDWRVVHAAWQRPGAAGP